MPFYGMGSNSGQGMNLQQTVSAATSNQESFRGGPHHPITCSGELFYYDDGSFSCEHAKAPADDLRTQQSVTHSIAILLIELAMEL